MYIINNSINGFYLAYAVSGGIRLVSGAAGVVPPGKKQQVAISGASTTVGLYWVGSGGQPPTIYKTPPFITVKALPKAVFVASVQYYPSGNMPASGNIPMTEDPSEG